MNYYPHRMVIAGSGSATRDENGNLIPGSSGASTETICRAEPASGNGQIKTTGGTAINYSWIVYFPLNAPEISEGSKVEVFDGAKKIATDIIKRFHRGRFNARAWL